MLRIDTHHHAIPSFYREMLRKARIDEVGGRALPDWSPDGSLQKTYSGLRPDARATIERDAALALFPRLGAAAPPTPGSALDRARRGVSRAAMRGVVRLVNTR